MQINWYANGINALISLFSRLYEATLFPFIQVFLLAQVLDYLTSGQKLTYTPLLPYIAAYVIATVFKVVMTSYLDGKEVLTLYQREDYIELQIDKKLATLDPATFEDSKFQELLVQMQGIKGTIGEYTIGAMELINAVFKVLTAGVVIATSFPIFIPIIFIATIPSFFAFHQYRKKAWPFFTEKRASLDRLLVYVKGLLSQDTTSKEVSIYSTGDILLEKATFHQKAYMKKFRSAVNKGVVMIILTRMIQIGAFFYTQWKNLSGVLNGTLAIGQFTLYFQQTLFLTLGIEGILDAYSSINTRSKYIEKYFDFFATEPAIKNPKITKPIPVKPQPAVIEFKDVSFRYPKSSRNVLKNFNLKIESGDKVALVGENGAGKSTLIKLILRFFDVTKGEILVNGVNIKELDIAKWRGQVGALFQEYIKYQFTFEENVYFGNASQKNNHEAIKAAIEKSGSDAYMEGLPRKYEQVVGKMFDGGIDLSGGQWQKLALARAFFRNAPMLILDEPTSAIDAKAEYEIFQRVQNLQKDKTVIIISHRFSTVRNADRILVLDEGRIIEEGNHKKLMEKKGLYAELFNIQAQGYK